MKVYLAIKTETNYMNGSDAKDVKVLGVFSSEQRARARLEKDVREFVEGCSAYQKVRAFTELDDYEFDGAWAYDSNAEPVTELENDEGDPVDCTQLEVYEQELDAVHEGNYLC